MTFKNITRLEEQLDNYRLQNLGVVRERLLKDLPYDERQRMETLYNMEIRKLHTTEAKREALGWWTEYLGLTAGERR